MTRGGPTRPVRLPTSEDLRLAALVVRRHLVPTPLIDAGLPGPVLLKLETVQPTGSFKVRGGLAAVAAAGAAHVIAASAGNHGLGVGWAAGRLGVTATIVVPETAAPAKLASLSRLPVELVRTGTCYEAAEAHALELAADGDSTFISPYNDPRVIAGQATIGTELRQQVRGLARVLAPVGGGGLVSGIALALAGSGVGVVGVEAERSPALAAAVAAGSVVPVVVGPTIADGLAGNLEQGSITVELVRAHAVGLMTVTEEEIVTAMRFLAAEHGLVVEGSGAVALAAVLAGRVEAVDGATVVVVTGRNIDLASWAKVTCL